MDEQYLFAYTHSDGFSGRLLNADFVIDYDYNFTLELSAFSHRNKTKNNSNQFIETGQISEITRTHIENLLSADFNSLKKEYTPNELAITDAGMQQVFINLDKITKYIYILDGYPKSCFKTHTEQLLYALNEYFKIRIENTYQNWLKE